MQMGTDWKLLFKNIDGFRIDMAKHYSCREPIYGHRHTHENQFHITYVVSGNGRISIDNAEFTVGPYDAIFIRPRQVHFSIDDNDTNYELMEFKFSALTVESEDSVPFLAPVIKVQNLTTFVPALERLISASMLDSSGFGYLGLTRLAETLILLERESNLLSDIKPGSRDMQVRIRQAAEYIALHYTEKLTVSDLAELVGVSPSHFAVMFTAITSTSPNKMLIQVRLRHVKEMLSCTDFPIEQIAEMCGFDSPQYLSRIFHQVEGMTPSSYRQHFQADQS
jgi:AraC-like DNA-binding protein